MFWFESKSPGVFLIYFREFIHFYSFLDLFPIQNVGKFFVSMENVRKWPFSAIFRTSKWGSNCPYFAFISPIFPFISPAFQGNFNANRNFLSFSLFLISFSFFETKRNVNPTLRSGFSSQSEALLAEYGNFPRKLPSSTAPLGQ